MALVPVFDMHDWKFFDTVEDWHAEGEKVILRAQRQLQREESGQF